MQEQLMRESIYIPDPALRKEIDFLSEQDALNQSFIGSRNPALYKIEPGCWYDDKGGRHYREVINPETGLPDDRWT